MQAERAPVLGIALAVIVLVLEGVGLLAYQDRGTQCGRSVVQAPNEPIGNVVLEDITLVPQEVDYCSTPARTRGLDSQLAGVDKLCLTRGRR